MKQNIGLFISIMLIFFMGLSLPAQDFGIILEQNLNIDARRPAWDDTQYEYSGILMPRFSAFLGDNGEIVLSAGINYGPDPVSFSRPWVFVPELLRTDIAMRFGMAELKLGRMQYTDPLGIIAKGLFDGLRFSYDTKAGTLYAGGWYTGFLYKKRAVIEMTDDELQHKYAELDYNDFANTYFAPRRVLSSMGWVHPSLGGSLSMQVAILGQFDLTDAELHSQYLTARLAVPTRNFIFDIGGCFELLEVSGEFEKALAAGLGLTLILPTRLEKHIALRGYFSSGVIGDNSIGAFLPLTTIPQGNLLQAKLSRLSVISLDFLARLSHTLSTNLCASHFVRSDLGTYTSYPVSGTDSDGYFLGTEFFGRLLWGVSSDLQINLGLGAFLPSLGNAAPKADMLWRAEFNVKFSLY
jgi:hypothetical protein